MIARVYKECGALKGKVRMVFFAAMFWISGWSAACEKMDGNGECRIDYESLVDGGLKCGEDFSYVEEQDGKAVFGIKAMPYINLDLAGVVKMDTVARVLVLAEGTEESLDLDLTVKICHVEFPRIEVPGQPEPTYLDLVPEAYEALEPVPVAGRLSGNRTCDSWETETAVFVFGARLGGDAMGPLPLDPEAQTCMGDGDIDCIYDLDGDGLPGATMIAEHFPVLDIRRLETTMRTAVSLSGIVVGLDAIVGSVEMLLDIRILGCHIWDNTLSRERECSGEEKRVVQGMKPTVVQLAQPESPFAAVRVPLDLTCEELLEDETLYFGY